MKGYEKRNSIFLLLVGISIQSTYNFVEADASQNDANWSVYTNQTYGINMTYNKNWDIVSTNMGDFNIVGFRSPPSAYGNSEFLYISLDPNPLVDKPITLEEYAEHVLNWTSWISNTPIELENITLTNLSGRPAYNLSYEILQGKQNSERWLEIGTVVNDRIYFVEYIADSSEYLKNLPAIQRMLDSLEISIAPRSNDTSSANTYTDVKTGTSMMYPSTWKKLDGDITDFASVLGSRYVSSVDFLPPLESRGRLDRVVEESGLTIEEVPFNTSLLEYAQAEITLVNKSSMDFKLIESDSEYALDGIRGYRYVANYSLQGIDYQRMVVMLMNEGRLYYFYFISEPSKFHVNLPTIQIMLESLNIPQQSDMESGLRS